MSDRVSLGAGSRHGPIQATARIVPPYLYEVLWGMALNGPTTAMEIASARNRPADRKSWQRWTSQQAANRMRTVVKLGLVERSKEGIYSLTPFGREWMSTGGERVS
jgi:hypothetical protein